MKNLKLLLLTIITVILAFAVTFAACGGKEPAHDGDTDNGNSFVNPGDSLGGGGTGEVADGVDSTESNAVRDEIIDKSDLTELSKNISDEGATEIKPADGIVEISDSGSYLFKGEYGGIKIAKASLKLHFIFDGATVMNEKGVAIDGTEVKKTELVITLKEGTENTVRNGKDNAVHIKGSLGVNGKGTLSVTSTGKSALKASKEIRIADATLRLTAVNHAVTGAAVIAANCTVNVPSAGKDGINAECDGATAFTTDDGFVSLTNVNYTCDVSGDGIQADTVIYIDGGNYSIKTNGNFVQKTSANMEEYEMTSDDFKYIKSGETFKRIASDETGRYGSNLYGLSQGCKGIKVGEIEYVDDEGKTVTVTDGNYLIAVVGGTFDIDSTDDGIHANSGNAIIEGGAFSISTYDDAITSDNLTKITGGDITVRTSYEGIEGGYIEISGGTIDIISSDDGINAASDDKSVTEHIIISGGEITVDSSGDGIDSNGSILISGGTVTVHGPTSGRDAGLDADKGIVITGGTVFVTSTLGMVETPSTNSTQYVISYAHQSTIPAGSAITICDKDGNALVSVTVKKNCQSVIISSPDMKKGETYQIYGGDTLMTDFTVSSIITTVGSSGGRFPDGGFGGRPRR